MLKKSCMQMASMESSGMVARVRNIGVSVDRDNLIGFPVTIIIIIS
jgi:hypothetical protein